MSEVVVKYHHESEGWWAESDDVPRFSAAGATYGEVVRQVRAALPEILDVPESNLRELIVTDSAIDVSNMSASSAIVSFNPCVSAAPPIPREKTFQLFMMQASKFLLSPGSHG
jgi:predicted RNase H-like HicB family nuclease